MTIIFASLHPEICYYIANNLKEHSCLVIADSKALFTTIKNQKECADLLVLDYKLFNHEIFNIYHYLKQEYLFLPTIFYNDPCMMFNDRRLHWIQMSKMIYAENDNFKIELYKDVFEKFSNILQAKELLPYLEFRNTQKELDIDFDIQELKYTKNSILELKKRVKLPDNLYFLLSILFDCKERTLSYEEITKVYEEHDKKITTNSVKVLLSNLRKYLATDDKNKFSIIKKKTGFQLLCM
ncbi:MAG: hypothetical protein GX677_11100 [Treponema sp.]|nr:hypothetical protein [Treponema sp.]